jgi:hypothetical protein
MNAQFEDRGPIAVGRCEDHRIWAIDQRFYYVFEKGLHTQVAEIKQPAPEPLCALF